MHTSTEQEIPSDDMRDQLAEQLGQLGDAPLTITNGAEAVGVLRSPQAYAHIRRVQAYMQMLTIAADLRVGGVIADELAQAARADLETRG